jgi:hypothetical protein
MKTLKEFQQLHEIGDGTKSYSYRQTKMAMHLSGDIIYKFKDEDGDEYMVVMSWLGKGLHKVDALSLDFTGPNDLMPTNKGLKTMFRVMTTIVDIAKEVVMTLHKKGVVDIGIIMSSTTSSGKGEKDAKARNNLYAAYARKALGGAQVTQNPRGLTIKIPDRFYK